jgi:para-aminobenzoate synthetase component 1
MAASPRTIVRGWGDTVEQTTVYPGTTVRSTGRALDIVAQLLDQRQSLGDFYASFGYCPDESEAPDDLPPFQGGAAGYIGYEYGGVLEDIPQPHADVDIPDVVIGIYDWTIAWDHVTNRCWVFADSPAMLDVLEKMIRGTPPFHGNGSDNKISTQFSTSFKSTFIRADYERAVEQVREYIRAGDIFQANLSQRFEELLETTPFALYHALRAVNPAPFSCYFDAGDAVVISASPERFLRADETGHVETYPIKGTRPRSEDPARDAALRDELLASEKDAAEHVMIVDVLRNDLSRVCEYGSVQVPALMHLESYATVHHLVSKITGQLRESMTAIDLLQAAFPGGSITGAPKIRAMEIIAELEPVTRGVYCGAIGYVSVTGAMDTSIAIRTCVVRDKRVYFAAGGGIVADSDPAAEYEETLVKASALRSAVELANTNSTQNTHVLAPGTLTSLTGRPPRRPVK